MPNFMRFVLFGSGRLTRSGLPRVYRNLRLVESASPARCPYYKRGRKRNHFEQRARSSIRAENFQPQIFRHRIEVAVRVQKQVVIEETECADHDVDCFADGYSLRPKESIIACTGDGDVAPGHVLKLKRRQCARDSQEL